MADYYRKTVNNTANDIKLKMQMAGFTLKLSKKNINKINDLLEVDKNIKKDIVNNSNSIKNMKNEIDLKLSDKIDKSNIDNLLSDNYYDKTNINLKFGDLYNKEYIDSKLGNIYDKTYINNLSNNSYNRTYLITSNRICEIKHCATVHFFWFFDFRLSSLYSYILILNIDTLLTSPPCCKDMSLRHSHSHISPHPSYRLLCRYIFANM